MLVGRDGAVDMSPNITGAAAHRLQHECRYNVESRTVG
jgi:hypothetical protein